MTKRQVDSLRANIDALKREGVYWRERHDALLDSMTARAKLQEMPQPMMLAHAGSFNAGKAMAFNEASYTIGIDTVDGVHAVVVYRLVPGQPTTMVAKAMLPQDDWK